MTRFYLHLHEQGKVVPDAEGLERPDLASAMRAAVDSARDVMAADVQVEGEPSGRQRHPFVVRLGAVERLELAGREPAGPKRRPHTG